MDAEVRAAAALLAHFSQEFTAVVDDAMGTDFADNGEIRVLVAILGDVPPSTADLAELSRLNRRAVSRFVSWLETAGLATVGRSDRDGRVVLVNRTPRARRRGNRMRRQLEVMFDRSRPLAADVVRLLGGSAQEPGATPVRDSLAVLDALAQAGLKIIDRASLDGGASRLPARQRVALTRLASHAELRPTQLMDTLGLTSGGVTYLVDQLAAAGFVRRRYGGLDTDRRAVTITITPSGLTAVSGIYQGIAATRGPLCDVFAEIRDRLPHLDRARVAAG